MTMLASMDRCGVWPACASIGFMLGPILHPSRCSAVLRVSVTTGYNLPSTNEQLIRFLELREEDLIRYGRHLGSNKESGLSMAPAVAVPWLQLRSPVYSF